MEKLLLLVFIVLFVDSLIFIIVKTYNDLMRIKNELNSNYKDLNKEITYRMDLSKKYLDIVKGYLSSELNDTVVETIAVFKNRVSIVDIADSYYRINNCITDMHKEISGSFAAPEWDKAFEESYSRIEALRVVYDDNVLKMNNVIKLPGTSFIAKVFGFVKWPYFRNA